MKQSFLCARCARSMCTDCRSIADEYHELYTRQQQALYQAEQALLAARQERDVYQQSRDDYKRVLSLGINAQMLAWLNSLTPAQLRASVEEAAKQ